jgi:hypothetical protein
VETYFNENWTSEETLERLKTLCRRTNHLPGKVLEIGCWEGKSTIAIANACAPDEVIAIDTWAGSSDEKPDHITVRICNERDVFAQFLQNIKLSTSGNIQVVRQDCHAFMAAFGEPIRFCYIDASHDYSSVKRSIDYVLRTGKEKFPDDPELLFWEAMILRQEKNLDGAIHCLRRLLQLPRSTHFTGADEGMFEAQAFAFLACLIKILLREIRRHRTKKIAPRHCEPPGYSLLCPVF